jgi:hypothetical protein
MHPPVLLEYDGVRGSAGDRRRSCAVRVSASIAAGSLVALLCYGVAYLAVRQSHTKRWFDKDAEKSVPYTLFDAYSRSEGLLYILFRPAGALDHAITGRTFEYDKW